ncbi:RNA 3'-terminal phosphate cyclase-like protein [Galendromus occidentalis]|uniref:RNA 3'-terminal phosphate cyclase-like protein n=1 Tax=Galendromus occidentalis TaxID=34638 RepID=A0AAJ6VWV1_9ACAR|nr:RNA 3'-terminal phosphate cyclase-like protein [Galendromus occidentalis]
MSPSIDGNVLSYQGSNYFRQRLVLAVLSQRSIVVSGIRNQDVDPGLRDFEADFLKLITEITNGTQASVNETGTRVFFKPGILHGGSIEHRCVASKSVSYYLEGLIYLAPFCKHPLDVRLFGITNDCEEQSVDAFKQTSLPVLGKFMYTENLDLKIISRGAPPLGGGEVRFTAPVCRRLRATQFTDAGKIKRVRGWAYCMKTNPQVTSRMVDSAKQLLLKFLPDVYIYTDACKGKRGGSSPAFGICLVAETRGGAFYAADAMSEPSKGREEMVPEVIGKTAAVNLVREIYRGGCVDTANQSLALLLMALGPADVSKYQFGTLTPFTIQFLRHLKDFFGLTFKIAIDKRAESEEDVLRTGGEKLQLSCIGTGYLNISKKLA